MWDLLIENWLIIIIVGSILNYVIALLWVQDSFWWYYDDDVWTHWFAVWVIEAILYVGGYFIFSFLADKYHSFLIMGFGWKIALFMGSVLLSGIYAWYKKENDYEPIAKSFFIMFGILLGVNLVGLIILL